MDLEKIRKINELTKTLQQHNFATSSLDAVQGASQIYNETPKTEENPFQQKSQLGTPFVAQTQPQSQNFTVTPAPVQEQKSSESPSLLERRYQLILEMNTKRYDQEINSLKEQISTLSGQIMSLRGDIMKISSQQKPQFQEVKSEVKNEQTQQTQSLNQQYQQELAQQSTQQNTTPEPKKEHPRQGSFTSQDVPIEKFFYFGRK